jgi:hypothetical protein
MTSAPVTDERIHRNVIEPILRTALGVETGGVQRVYDYGKVPGFDGNAGPPPKIFALPTLERRYVGPRRAGRAGRSGWRLSVRYVGRTVDEARWALNEITVAIDERRLTIGGVTSTPVTHESTTDIAPDDGRYSGLTVWVYAL